MNKQNNQNDSQVLAKYRYCLIYAKPHSKSPQWLKDKHNSYLQEVTGYLSIKFDKQFERIDNKIYTDNADAALWCRLMYSDNLQDVQISHQKK
jgi:hypothetical protein